LPEREETSNLNLTLARVLGLVVRRRWWILTPLFCVALGVTAVLAAIPNYYTSTATLLVVQQQVPERYVVPNSTTDVTSALQAMKQEVLSRTQLLRMINDFGLYPRQRKRMAPEQLVEVMNANIDILPLNENPQKNKDFDAFKISFTTENALVAQQVTNNLTSLFINEYLRTGAEQATNTTNFLHQQVEEKGKELQVQEERLRDFKLQHAGELPEQQQGNLGILTGLQTQLNNTMNSLDRAQQQRALLQAQSDGMPRRRTAADLGPAAAVPGTAAPAPGANPLEVARTDLSRLEAARADMVGKGYTSDHPDMKINQRAIDQARAKLRRLEAEVPPPGKNEKASTLPVRNSGPASTEPADDPVVAQLKSNQEANRIEIANLSREENRLKAAIAQYENRINQTPVREEQEAGVLRDTEVLRQQYSDLLKKEQESQLATNLEKQQGGQQFRLIDPASFPTVPSSPKRMKISLGGLAGGLVLGIALALFMEMRDTSYGVARDLTEDLVPPFVVEIPLLRTPKEERRLRTRTMFEWIVAAVMLFIVSASEFYVHKLG